MASDPLRANQNVEKFERYDEVSVLMIRWEHHDWAPDPDVTALGGDILRHEIDKLKTVYCSMNYGVKEFLIPDDNAQYHLGHALDVFIEAHDLNGSGKRKLLIVHYGGHGKQLWQSGPTSDANLNIKRESCGLVILQSENCDINNGVPWRNVMLKLLRAQADVFVVVDSCHAAATARPEGHLDPHIPRTRAMKRTARAEFLACACVEANPVGPENPESFTNLFRKHLEELLVLESDLCTTSSLHGGLCIDRPTVTTSVLVDLVRANLGPIVLHKIPVQDAGTADTNTAGSSGGFSPRTSLSSAAVSPLDNRGYRSSLGEASYSLEISPEKESDEFEVQGPPETPSLLSEPSHEIRASQMPLHGSSFLSTSIAETTSRTVNSPEDTLDTQATSTISIGAPTSSLHQLLGPSGTNCSRHMSPARGKLSQHRFMKRPSSAPLLQRVFMQDMTVALAEHCLITHPNGTLSGAPSSKQSLAKLMAPGIANQQSLNLLGYIRWQEKITTPSRKLFPRLMPQPLTCEDKLSDDHGQNNQPGSSNSTQRKSYCLIWKLPDEYSPELKNITLQEAIQPHNTPPPAMERVHIAKWLLRVLRELELGGVDTEGIELANIVFFQKKNQQKAKVWDFSNPYLFGFAGSSGQPPQGPQAPRNITSIFQMGRFRRGPKRPSSAMLPILYSIGLWRPILTTRRSWDTYALSPRSCRSRTFSQDLRNELGNQHFQAFSNATALFQGSYPGVSRLFERAYELLDQPTGAGQSPKNHDNCHATAQVNGA